MTHVSATSEVVGIGCREMSRRLFDQNRVYGVSGLLLSHSYYDTAEWVRILQEAIGERFLLDSATEVTNPKVTNRVHFDRSVGSAFAFAQVRFSAVLRVVRCE